jgi:hypothetical protein
MLLYLSRSCDYGRAAAEVEQIGKVASSSIALLGQRRGAHSSGPEVGLEVGESLHDAARTAATAAQLLPVPPDERPTMRGTTLHSESRWSQLWHTRSLACEVGG